MPDSAQPSSALQKAIAILETVTGDSRPLGLTEVSARVGLPKQTVHRVLRQLEDSGLLMRDPAHDRYGVGPRLNRLALAALYATFQSAPIRAILQDLVATTGETCNVGMLDGHEVVYIERMECDWPLKVELQAGSRVPVHCTAIGKLLLAHLPRRAQRRILSSLTLARYTAGTITEPDKLERELVGIRGLGYATNDEEYSLGLIAVSVPIFDDGGQAVAALAVHAPAARLSLAEACEHLPALHRAAKQLADVLEPSDAG